MSMHVKLGLDCGDAIGTGDVVTGILTDIRKVFAHENKESMLAAPAADNDDDF